MTRDEWAGMTDKAKTIKVARLCGWKKIKKYLDTRDILEGLVTMANGTWGWGVVPDYLNDLNAMHKAVAQMTEVQFCQYVKLLCGYQGHKGRLPWSGGDAGRAEKATAAERAVAFVLAMHECRNDWKEQD